MLKSTSFQVLDGCPALRRHPACRPSLETLFTPSPSPVSRLPSPVSRLTSPRCPERCGTLSPALCALHANMTCYQERLRAVPWWCQKKRSTCSLPTSLWMPAMVAIVRVFPPYSARYFSRHQVRIGIGIGIGIGNGNGIPNWPCSGAHAKIHSNRIDKSLHHFQNTPVPLGPGHAAIQEPQRPCFSVPPTMP